jgi:hypothetical protein
MTPRTMRKAERAVHLVWALLLALYVYGLLPSWGESAVRWIVVPGIAASGFAMWFAAPLRKLVRNLRGAGWTDGRTSDAGEVKSRGDLVHR